MLPFVFAGLTTGSIFAIAAMGLVLTYKTSGIFNFAHGALASASAFLFYFLHDQRDVPWPIAAALCVLGAGPLLGLVLERLARRLQSRPLTVKILGTVGLLLVIQGAIDLVYPPGVQRSVPQFLPTGPVSLFGTPVALYRIIIVALALVVMIALTLLLRRSRAGLAMRAVVDDAELLDTVGTSPVRTRRLAWVIGSCTAALSGVLLVPLLQLDSTTFTLLIVTAFGAAAFGAFTNLPLVYAGGLVIGVGQAVLQKYFLNATSLAGGLAPALPFLVLFALLLAAPRLRRPGGSGFVLPRPRDGGWTPPWTVRAGGTVVLLAVLLCVPLFAGFHIVAWTRFLAYVIVFLSLGLLVRLSAQVSLAHVSFMVIGVATFAHLTSAGWPWPLALPAAGAVAAPVGALLAIPAIRFPGLYLALATFGFGLLLQSAFYAQPYMFGPLGFGLDLPRPRLGPLSGDTGYYYLVLAFTVAAALLVLVIERGRLGRLLRAMADSPAGLAACGASINVSKVLVFCLSASMAAVAGVLDGAAMGNVGPEGYQPLVSLQLFAVMAIAIGRLPWYAVVAAAGHVLIPAQLSNDAAVTSALTLVFGAIAVQIAVQQAPPAVPEAVRRALDRLAAPPLRRRRRDDGAPAPAEAVPAVLAAETGDASLSVTGLTVRYGGHVAVDEVSLTARTGEITGLIGPNGAGKTTVFNACSGSLRPAAGSVTLGGDRVDRLGAPARARHGLGRTFQRVELFDTLTVRENVALGREGRYANWNPLTHLVARPAQSADVARRTSIALTLCGLDDVADVSVATLSTGRRRLVELARCLAGGFGLLLLDEPSSGLDRAETEAFGDILTRVVREGGVGVLLVEHDVTLINRLCDRVYVLDFGRQIFAGGAREARESERVRDAYLGQGAGRLATPGSSAEEEVTT
jgi:ABC-type branched-subunit amino acid transport system ATPase component/branched-subunit amino acid ABC-type transport system permease component